jgi:F-type H+-transporting ATPase subunit delta
MARRDTAARRYAEAAFEIALRDGTVDAWRSELAAAASLLADEQIRPVLASPAVPIASRMEILTRVLVGTADGPVVNLISLLLRRGRIEQLPRVAAEFKRLDDLRQGITPATATTAAALEPAEVRALTERLEQFTGGRVELDIQVDPSLLGGLVVRVGDRLIDGSVRGRLERLRNQLVSGAL